MRFVFVLMLPVILFAADVSARAFMTGQETARLGDVTLTVFTYRPMDCRPRALLFVFHGDNRNASDYRDNARPLADRLCLEVVAPLFERDRFPGWRYQRGGIVRKGNVLPETAWTVTLVGRLVTWARQRALRPAMPFYLFGHSAGGQFLSRVAAYSPPPDAGRIVIANPSSHVVPSLEEAAPYGFGGMFDGEGSEVLLKQYLALPVTIYLGGADTGQKALHNHPAARRQGGNRLERGHSVYESAKAMAQQKGWLFNWTLVTVPGVGHSSRGLLSVPQAVEALGLSP